MKSFLHILQILISLGLGIFYPFWIANDIFDGNWYGIIGSGIAIYGSLVGGVYYEYLRYKRNK